MNKAKVGGTALPKLKSPSTSSTNKGKIEGGQKKANKIANTAEISLPPIVASSESGAEIAVGPPIEAVALPTDAAPTPVTNSLSSSATSAAMSAENVDNVITIETTAAEPPKCENGLVTLKYEMYDEKFEIKDGSTTAANIDEVYCLSYVMPNCVIHLSRHSPEVRRKELEQNESVTSDFYLPEDPMGTYHGLVVDEIYYVYIEQQEEQLRRDQIETAARLASLEGAGPKKKDDIVRDDGRVLESCSCIYGNPCVDEYGCRDWSNRFAIATKNGWKGF